ncbi:MAG: hypothetical protein IJ193_08005 [Bacilli bacterium]|nr:hypothetical protein [Bacilli bacterium]
MYSEYISNIKLEAYGRLTYNTYAGINLCSGSDAGVGNVNYAHATGGNVPVHITQSVVVQSI